jgi:hypothetical protein
MTFAEYMKNKISISETDANEASHHGTPVIEKESKVQKRILGCAVTSMILGMGCWLLKNYAAFFFFGFGILLMGAVYAMDLKNMK